MVSAREPKPKPDHVILYKGKAARYAKKMILDNGEIDLEPLSTSREGDFERERDTQYFTREKETALKYVRWAEVRNSDSDI